MGRPKWRETVGGVPMALRAAEVLAPPVREVVLLAPDPDSGALGLPVVADTPGALVSAWVGDDVVAPEQAGRVQPLCAVWSVKRIGVSALGRQIRSSTST